MIKDQFLLEVFLVNGLTTKRSVLFFVIFVFDRPRHEMQHTLVQRFLLLPTKPTESRFFGMVYTVLQRFHEQPDTSLVPFRSTKLTINVLLAHWHHVRTTNTVIVASSYEHFSLLRVEPFLFRHIDAK